MMKNFLFLCLYFALNGVVFAKEFANQYCSFELPPSWECVMEGSEYVCQSDNADRKKEAIIILAAKLRGERDSLDQYQAYLKETKTFALPGGKTQVSEPKYANMKEINEHRWVDSLHLASEVPGFYTRYLATVKEDLGVAITFSVAKDRYNDYQAIFDSIVATLRVFRQKNVDPNSMNLKSKDANILAGDSSFIGDDQRMDIGVSQKKQPGGGSSGTSTLILLLVVVAAVIFILKKLKSKNKK